MNKVLILLLAMLLPLSGLSKINGVSGSSATRKEGIHWVSDYLSDSINTPKSIHSVRLSWDYPTQREDGSALALNEIKEYRIYDRDTLIMTVSFDTKTVDINAIRGTHYYTISTVTIDDREGAKSSTLKYIVRHTQ